MIAIREPRYSDQVVLVARYKIPCAHDIVVEIQKGARAGVYKVKHEDIIRSPIESMKTRTGKSLQMRAIPLDYLERIESEE